jgi:hypothetical protein
MLVFYVGRKMRLAVWFSVVGLPKETHHTTPHHQTQLHQTLTVIEYHEWYVRETLVDANHSWEAYRLDTEELHTQT